MNSRIPLWGILLAVPLCLSLAEGADWWVKRSVALKQPAHLGDVDYDAQVYADWMARNYGPALVGQAKHLAKQAYLEMEAQAPGSTGPEIEQMIAAFSIEQEDNYAPLLIGQLKAIARPFYARFAEVEYAPEGISLHDRTAYPFPWDDQTPLAENYYPANVGQLKYVFSFDLGDWAIRANPWESVPDAWKQRIVDFDPDDAIGALDQVLADDDFDGDSISNRDEYVAGGDPIDFFSGFSPQLELRVDADLVGRAGVPLATPLAVRVTDAPTGAPLPGKPVRFCLKRGHALIAQAEGLHQWAEIVVAYTDGDGIASCRVRQEGLLPSEISAIVSTAGGGVHASFWVRAWGSIPDRMFVGGDHSLHLTPNGDSHGWGRNQFGQLGLGHANPVLEPVPQGNKYSLLALGNGHTVGLTKTGELVAWGANEFGQLGDGTLDAQWAPKPVMAPDAWTGRAIIGVEAGDSFTLVLLDDGSLWGWGLNAAGQLGLGVEAPEFLTIPTQIATGKTFRAIAAGARHSLAVTQDGLLYAWGENQSGQCAANSATRIRVPRRVSLPASEEVALIAAGREHSLALTVDGAVYAWGSNVFGQLGTQEPGARATPALLDLPEPAIAIACGDHASFAVSESGRATAWGANFAEQLAANDAGDDPFLPIALHTDGLDVLSLGAGRDHAFLTDAAGDTYLWGDNRYNQLGSDASAPVVLEASD